MTTETNRKTVDFTGTVIHATMRPEDLIPAFTEVLKNVDVSYFNNDHVIAAEEALEFHREAERILAYFRLTRPNDAGLLASAQQVVDTLYGDMQDEVDALFDELNAVAPEGHYFGASEGDGSDYGFWPVEAEDEDEGPTDEETRQAYLDSMYPECRKGNCDDCPRQADGSCGCKCHTCGLCGDYMNFCPHYGGQE